VLAKVAEQHVKGDDEYGGELAVLAIGEGINDFGDEVA
jgi:hypothetical protein